MATVSCIDDGAISAYAEGRLAGAEITAVEEHIDGCASCRQAIAAALADTEADRVAGAAPPKRRSFLHDQAEAVIPPRYRLLDVLGRGGMGGVIRAFDDEIGREVAIKVLDPRLAQDADHRERFAREAKALGRIDHPHVVGVYDVDGDLGYLVMELVGGDPLDDFAGSDVERRLDASRVRRIAEELLDALAAVHAAGIVHRDIKPSNVVLRADGRATLVDFGVARMAAADRGEARGGGGELTRGGASPGTPAYMAPEQLHAGTVDARTDLYGLGATLFHVLVGERYDPAKGRPLAELRRVCHDRVLSKTIARCLKADPAARFPSAASARAHLAAAQRPWGSWLTLIAAGTGIVIAAAAVSGRAHPTRPTVTASRTSIQAPTESSAAHEEVFLLAQRGELQRAQTVLEHHLVDHPDDPGGNVLQVLLAWWLHSAPELVGAIGDRARRAPLSGADRAIVEAVQLLTSGRPQEARALLENAARAGPDRADVAYVLGEAAWSEGMHDAAMQNFERAFELDPRWQPALARAIDFHLGAGDIERVRRLLDRMRTTSPAAALDVESKCAFAERDYQRAAELATEATVRFPDSHRPWVRLAEASVLKNDLASAEQALAHAVRPGSDDDGADGPRAHALELRLYRGDLDGYASEALPPQRFLAELLWKGASSVDLPSTAFASPLDAATEILSSLQRGHRLALRSSQPEVVAYAAEHYEEGLERAASSEIRLLLAHAAAGARFRAGDAKGASKACEEVLFPRVYHPYRALLMPDCVLWSAQGGSADVWRFADWLVSAWSGGSFRHPSLRTLSRIRG